MIPCAAFITVITIIMGANRKVRHLLLLLILSFPMKVNNTEKNNSSRSSNGVMVF